MRPFVLSERATLEHVRDNRCGLARFGDGEITIAACGKASPGQEYDPKLAKRLRQAAANDLPELLVAIPNIFDGIPKHMRVSWERWTVPERMALWRYDKLYGSAFIGRPDFYGKPFGADYWGLMRSLWQDRPVLAVRGDDRRPSLLDNAAQVDVVTGPPRDAWQEYDRILRACLEWVDVVPGGLIVLMLGPTATVLAYDLARLGVQALDLGKAPRFYAKECG